MEKVNTKVPKKGVYLQNKDGFPIYTIQNFLMHNIMDKI